MNGKKLKKRIAQLLVTAFVFVIAFSFAKDRALAVLGPDEAVRFSQFSSKNNIGVSTLFIGTYLIHMDALTDELYEKAVDSASQSSQMKIYYKSEVGDDLWYDVTDAESLSDIMNSANSVPESDLADLFVQYYVGSDGILIDTSNGAEVNPFDIPDPYDLSKLKELEPLWSQFSDSKTGQTVSEDQYLIDKNSEITGRKRVDRYTYQILSTFFAMDLRDAETDGYDADLKRLYEAYKSLKAEKKQEEAEIVYSLMANVDAARRSVVMNKLAMLDEHALGVLYDLASGSYYTSSGDFRNPYTAGDSNAQDPGYLKSLKESLMQVREHDSEQEVAFQTDPDLISAIGECLQNCQQSYYDTQSKALMDGSTVLGHAQYVFSRQVIDEVSTSGAGNALTYLRDVRNISSNMVRNSESEVYLLDHSLLNLAETQYETALTRGASAEYTREASRGASSAAAEKALDTQMDDLEAKRSELEFLIDAYRMRVSAADGLLYVKGCISWTEGLYASVPDDAFKSRAGSSIDGHANWLKKASTEIRTSEESLKSKMDQLYDKKAELQSKRDQALDDNDLATANLYDDKIAAVDLDIAAEAARTGQSADAELADRIASEALAELAKDPKADVSAAVTALKDLDADEALDKLEDKLEEVGNPSASDAGSGSSDPGKEEGTSSAAIRLSEEDIRSALAAEFGKPVETMGAEDLAMATALVSRLGRNGVAAARSLAADMASLMRSKDSKYLYDQYEDKNPEYINLKTIGLCTDYRYYYDTSKRSVTMSDGGNSIVFVSGSDQIQRGGQEEKLMYKTVSDGTLYLSEEDAGVLLRCYSEYVLNTEYAVCLTESMEGRVNEILGSILE